MIDLFARLLVYLGVFMLFIRVFSVFAPPLLLDHTDWEAVAHYGYFYGIRFTIWACLYESAYQIYMDITQRKERQVCYYPYCSMNSAACRRCNLNAKK